MTKLFAAALLAASMMACTANKNEEQYNTKELFANYNADADTQEKFVFYKQLYTAGLYESLKSGINDSLPDSDFNDKALREVAKIIASPYLSKSDEEQKEIVLKLDSITANKKKLDEATDMALHEAFVGTLNGGTFVEAISKEFITLMTSYGTGASTHYQYLHIDGETVTDLGNVYEYLEPTAYAELEKTLKQTVSAYSHPSGRNETIIKKRGKYGYQVSFNALTAEDAEASPSLQISYRTKDFKTFAKNSIKIKSYR